MKFLGLDYGTKRVGVAISDPDEQFAFPRESFPNDADLIPRLLGLVESEHVGAIVIGDTKAATGAHNAATPRVEALVRALKVRVAVPVHETHEAWSSMEAARFAPKGKRHDDASAAAVILQRYLDGVQRSA